MVLWLSSALRHEISSEMVSFSGLRFNVMTQMLKHFLSAKLLGKGSSVQPQNSCPAGLQRVKQFIVSLEVTLSSSLNKHSRITEALFYHRFPVSINIINLYACGNFTRPLTPASQRRQTRSARALQSLTCNWLLSESYVKFKRRLSFSIKI